MLNPGELKLIGMGAKQAAKYSRAIFRDLISQLKSKQSVPKDEWYNGMRVPKLISDVSKKIVNTTNEPGPDAAKMIQKSGIDRLGSLSKLSSSSSADPTSFVSDAVRTGMIDGQKLSSQQRNELAQRLSLVKMVRQGDYPENNAFVEDAFKADTPIDLVRGMGSNNPIESLYYSDFKRAPALDKVYDIRRKNNLSARDRETIDRIRDEIPDMKRYESVYPDLSLTSTFNLDDIFNKAIGMKGRRGWHIGGVPDGRMNMKITAELYPKVLYNTIIKKYKITDPLVADTIKSLLPEWSGTPDELVAMAMML